jgi:hypothetical protein
LVIMSVAGALDVPGLTISFSPLAFPSIPLLPVVGILIALVPAVAAPNPLTTTETEQVTSGGQEQSAAGADETSNTVPSDLSGVTT